MSPPLCDTAFVHHNDFVTVADCTQTVGYDQAGTSLFTDICIDHLFCFCIQGTRSFIEYKNRWFGRKRSCNFQSLSLTPAEIFPIFSHNAFIGSRAGGYLFVYAGIFGSLNNVFICYGLIPEGDILLYRSLKQEKDSDPPWLWNYLMSGWKWFVWVCCRAGSPLSKDYITR